MKTEVRCPTYDSIGRMEVFLLLSITGCVDGAETGVEISKTASLQGLSEHVNCFGCVVVVVVKI